MLRFVRHWAFPLLAIFFAAVGACLTAYFWSWLHGQAENPSATIRNVGFVIATPVALVLAVWRSIIAQEQEDTTRRSLQEGRYQKAAEMLGSALLSVRLGGLYALFHLARDYPREFHLQVVELLAAFVRQWPTANRTSRINRRRSRSFKFPREEMQAILEFFGERTVEGRKIEKDARHTINLDESSLRGVRLSPGSRLDGVSLKLVDLSGAVFSEVQGLTKEQIHGSMQSSGVPANFRNTKDSATGEPLTVKFFKA